MELLLPVGNMEMCLAAIHGGADAIYVGMPGFNARGRSQNQTKEQLKEMIDLCHLYGVKVHIAFNILVFEDEIDYAIEMLDEVIPLGPDALIVQDLGLVNIIRDIYPEQVIHASTQMTITNDKAIKFLDDLNIKRFVLGRENSLSEIKIIKESTDKELEVFVHGALCVAYSGQCFTSESIGGRSANRGQCAQSCRFSYELIVDGEKKNLIDQNYLVSPQDLCGINEVPKLLEIGVHSFKVEGRLKSAAYVGTAAKAYKNTMKSLKINSTDIEKMATSYSRGFFSGWLNGVDHQKLAPAKYQDHRGIKIGQVTRVKGQTVSVQTPVQINKGMGIVICDDQRKVEIGSSIFDAFKNGSELVLSLSKDVDLNKVIIGNDIYLNSNPEVIKEVEKSVSDLEKQKRIHVEIELHAHVGKKAVLSFLDENDNFVEVESDLVLEAAQKDYDVEKIESDLKSLSRTVYSAARILTKFSSPKPFLHSKIIKKLKSDAVALLNGKRVHRQQLDRFGLSENITNNLKDSYQKTTLNILLRNLNQVETFINFYNNQSTQMTISITLDFEFGKDYAQACELLRTNKVEFGIATNRILKPGEFHHLNVIERLNPDYILARNLGSFEYLKNKNPKLRVKGDFSLNVSNSRSANYLLNKGFESLTSSYDMNGEQLLKLINNTQSNKIEVTTHQYMPSFHMEHCVFAAYLSKGSSFKDCGKPCEKHQVELKDQFGNMHFLKADQECRNTMFNAVAQSGASLLPKLLSNGVKIFRVEMLDEKSDILTKKIKNYISFFEEKISIDELINNLGVLEKFGIGTGQLLKNETKTMVSIHHRN